MFNFPSTHWPVLSPLTGPPPAGRALVRDNFINTLCIKPSRLPPSFCLPYCPHLDFPTYILVVWIFSYTHNLLFLSLTFYLSLYFSFSDMSTIHKVICTLLSRVNLSCSWLSRRFSLLLTFATTGPSVKAFLDPVTSAGCKLSRNSSSTIHFQVVRPTAASGKGSLRVALLPFCSTLCFSSCILNDCLVFWVREIEDAYGGEIWMFAELTVASILAQCIF